MSICPHCGIDKDVEKEVFSRDKLFTKHSCKGDKMKGLWDYMDLEHKLRCKCGWIGTPEEAKSWRTIKSSVQHRNGQVLDYDVVTEPECPKCDSFELDEIN